MNREEFITLIESLGFRLQEGFLNSYIYKGFIIDLYSDSYDFHNGSMWIFYKYNDLTEFIKTIRSYKLKKILG